MNKGNKEFSTLGELKLLLAKNWCETNGWSELQLINDEQFYAIPPNAYLPVELPEEALAELDKSRQILDVLWETQFLKRIGQANLKKAVIFNIACMTVLYIKFFLESLTNYANIPIFTHQLVNIIIALLILFMVIHISVAISGYWEHYQSKKKLIKLGFTELVVSLKTNVERT